ncbi:MAG: nicotinamide-nucleotide amidohydrolase family protein [Alphaproteobacteria bacterium]
MSPYPDDILAAAESVLNAARGKSLKIVTAESCTGGLLSGALTEIAGSSDVFERGYIVYSNLAKAEALGVDKQLLMAAGAVSAEVASAMAEGALTRSRSHLAVAITGIAGPGGGSPGKPVGLVHFAGLRRGAEPRPTERRFGDIGRAEVRLAAVREALDILRGLIA